MVWYCHRLKSDTLGIFEERVRPPDLREPLHGEEPVLRGHVVWQDQPGETLQSDTHLHIFYISNEFP